MLTNWVNFKICILNVLNYLKQDNYIFILYINKILFIILFIYLVNFNIILYNI